MAGGKGKSKKSTKKVKVEKVKVIKPKKKPLGYKTSKIETHTNFFPLKCKTKLQYSEDFAINTSTVSDIVNACAVNYSYRLTSCYDPRYESGGLQPLNYTILDDIYDVWKVYKAFIKVTFYNPTQDGMKCGIRVKPLGDTATSGLDIKVMEQNTDTCRVAVLNDTGSQIKTFTSWIYPWQILGISKQQYMGDTLYGHASGNNPSNYPMLDCFACTTNSNAAIRCTVNIDFYCIMSDRNLTT